MDALRAAQALPPLPPIRGLGGLAGLVEADLARAGTAGQARECALADASFLSETLPSLSCKLKHTEFSAKAAFGDEIHDPNVIAARSEAIASSAGFIYSQGKTPEERLSVLQVLATEVRKKPILSRVLASEPWIAWKNKGHENPYQEADLRGKIVKALPPALLAMSDKSGNAGVNRFWLDEPPTGWNGANWALFDLRQLGRISQGKRPLKDELKLCMFAPNTISEEESRSLELFDKLEESAGVRADGRRSVLVLGCSFGGMVRSLGRMGYDAHGIDLSSRVMGIVEASGVRNIRRANAESLPYPDQTFDRTFQSLLFYGEGGISLPMLEEMHRVGRPGSYHYLDQDRLQMPFKGEYLEYFKDAGFEVVQYHENLKLRNTTVQNSMMLRKR